MNHPERPEALDEEQGKALEEARKAALQKARDAIHELSELGVRYKLVESPDPAGAKAQPAPHPSNEPARPAPRMGGYDQTLLGS